jgi:DNA mismatch repair protein MutS2
VGKVRFDKTIATLQKERSKMEKTSQTLKEEESKAREEGKKMETINVKIKEKLESYQELYDSNQKLIYIGQKVDAISEKYFNSKNKKELVAEFLKIIEMDNSKRRKASVKETIVNKAKEKIIQKEVEVKVEAIRIEKKEKKIKANLVPEKPKVILKVGDRVRMFDGKAIGTIDKIEKNKAVVNYGVFTSTVSIEALEYVQNK